MRLNTLPSFLMYTARLSRTNLVDPATPCNDNDDGQSPSPTVIGYNYYVSVFEDGELRKRELIYTSLSHSDSQDSKRHDLEARKRYRALTSSWRADKLETKEEGDEDRRAHRDQDSEAIMAQDVKTTTTPPLFTPLTVRGVTFRNR